MCQDCARLLKLAPADICGLNSGLLAVGGTEYLVDTIALHDHLHALRDTLADPAITKVAFSGLPLA